MAKWRFLAGMLCGAAVAVMGYGLEQGRKTLSAQDYVEIRELYSRYYWIADSSPGEKWAKELFTPDAVWWIGNEKGGQQAVGTQQLAEISVRLSGKMPEPRRPQHICTNVSIERSPEGARGRCYFMMLNSEPGKPPTITSTGSYEDIVVKTSVGWRFKQRKMYQGMQPTEFTAGTSN